jgi:hypothetical protein
LSLLFDVILQWLGQQLADVCALCLQLLHAKHMARNPFVWYHLLHSLEARAHCWEQTACCVLPEIKLVAVTTYPHCALFLCKSQRCMWLAPAHPVVPGTACSGQTARANLIRRPSCGCLGLL